MKKPSDKSPRRTGAQLKAAIRRQPSVFAVYSELSKDEMKRQFTMFGWSLLFRQLGAF